MNSALNSVRRLLPLCLLPLGLCLPLAALCAGMPMLPVPPHTVGPNYAHAHGMTSLLHWERFPLRLFFTPTLYDDSEHRALVLAGFDEWVRATQGTVCYQIVPEASQADLTVTISAQVDVPQEARALGQTTLTYTGTLLSKAVIQVVVRDDDPAQFQEICAHEFGHALGINGHSDDPDDMMFPVLSHSLFQIDNPQLAFLCLPGTVTAHDVNTLKSAYPDAVFATKKH